MSQNATFGLRLAFLLGKKFSEMGKITGHYSSAKEIVYDPFAITQLRSLDLTLDEALCIRRWATNIVLASNEGWPGVTTDEIYQLGGMSDAVFLRIIFPFTNLFVLANSEPEDLRRCVPEMSQEEAETLLKNARNAQKARQVEQPVTIFLEVSELWMLISNEDTTKE